ncbi:MAG: helix-turn-helix domain-containing protein [Oscillospiraceae bacterium]|nr:helix-turn-helix domain-containing protein [Oscillospiraceae bacterium]
MNHYVTGALIKALREKKHFTQAELAEKICVSDKTISKWETGRGLPDITLLEPLAKALGISIIELLSGNSIINQNLASNMLRSKFYICPICGNVIHTTGEVITSCCGITLPVAEPEEPDKSHKIQIESVEDEYFITIPHEMTKQHYISFIAYVTTEKTEIIRLYPEGNAQARFSLRGTGRIYWYCNRHGLFYQYKKKI